MGSCASTELPPDQAELREVAIHLDEYEYQEDQFISDKLLEELKKILQEKLKNNKNIDKE